MIRLFLYLQAVNATDPDGWLAAFHASYHELRKATRGQAVEDSPS